MKRKWIWMAPLAIVALLAFIALGGEIVQQLWNWLLPPLFGWHAISFWQGLGMLALCRILFGGFGGQGSGRSNFRRRKGGRGEHLSPEDRDRFRQALRDRCGFGPAPSESGGQ